MSWRQVTILYAVLAALALQYWRIVRMPAPDPDAPRRERFVPYGADVMRELLLVHGGQRLVARREGAVWRVVDPSDAPIQPDLVAAFTVALASADEIQRVGDASRRLEEFGLDDRAVRVEVQAGGDGPLTLLLGDANPTGTGVYARRGDAGDVVLIGRQVRYYADLLLQAAAATHAPALPSDAPIG